MCTPGWMIVMMIRQMDRLSAEELLSNAQASRAGFTNEKGWKKFTARVKNLARPHKPMQPIKETSYEDTLARLRAAGVREVKKKDGNI